MKSIEKCPWCGLEVAFEASQRMSAQCPRCSNYIGMRPAGDSAVVCLSNNELGDIRLTAGNHTLGRRSERSRATVQLAVSDMYMSKCHTSLDVSYSGGRARVMAADAGSSNGTFVNEQRLAEGQRRELSTGDILRLGATSFTIRIL